MAFADTIKYNRIRSMKGLPIGAIIPWTSDAAAIPPGWVVCNGVTISNTKYPILYKIIGNAYGGTPGSTYKLPPLTQSAGGVVDAFIGHYNYLKNKGEAHAPTTTTDSASDDPFWNIIGRGTNGDVGSNSQTFWISTVDLVGEEISTAVQFQAIYDDIDVNDGSYFFTVTYTSRSLGVQHLPTHSHSDPSTEPTSFQKSNATVSRCTGTVPAGTPCNMRCDSTAAYRVAADPGIHEAISKGNIQADLRRNFKFDPDPRTGWTGEGGGGYFQPTTAYAETVASHYRGGDGECGGNMRCGSQILFTSLSHDEKNAGSPHTHGPNNYEMEGKYQVISPGLRTDIALNTVRINNSPGVNYGTINVETATPSLEMLFIIRAF